MPGFSACSTPSLDSFSVLPNRPPLAHPSALGSHDSYQGDLFMPAGSLQTPSGLSLDVEDQTYCHL